MARKRNRPDDSENGRAVYSYGAFDSKGFDTINIGNLNTHFEIPIFSKAGRGGLNFNYSLVYDSAIWTPSGVSGSQVWPPATLWGWQADTGAMMTGLTFSGSTIAANTHSVTYSYDQSSYNGLTIANGIGQMTGMSDGSGETAWSYDGLGNVLTVRKTINGVTKEASYAYNADSTPNTVTDFGGTVLTYTYNTAGQPTGITDGSGNTYASDAVYNAAGQLTSLNHQLTSSGAAYVRQWTYNSRLQPSVISATLNGTTTIQSLTYGYGASGANNGNIMSITNGLTSSRSQTFTYDNLNRLTSAHDVSNWGESYTYDNWGNLYQTTPMPGYASGNNWSALVSGTSNQLNNQRYDAAGEVTEDQLNNAYSYDAQGRLLTAGTGSYVYDGAGNRVEKTAGGTTTLYWPGASGILDESNSTGTVMAKQINFAGQTTFSVSLKFLPESM